MCKHAENNVICLGCPEVSKPWRLLIIGLLFLISSGPMSWAQETTAPPPVAVPSPSEAPPATPTEKAPVPEEKKPQSKQATPAPAEEKPNTEPSQQPATQTPQAPTVQPSAPATTPSTSVPPAPSPAPAVPSAETPPAEPAAPSAPTQPPAGAPTAPSPAPPAEEKPEAHKEAEKAIEQPEEAKEPTHEKTADVSQGGLLLKKGTIQIDTELDYTHFSNNQIFLNGFSVLPILVVGNVNVQRVRRDFLTASFTGKYGLMENVQLEVSIPFQVTFDDVASVEGIQGSGTPGANVETNSQTADLGDVSTTLYYQYWAEQTNRPAVIFGLAWKSKSGRDGFQTDDPASDPPSGTGFTSLKGIVSAIKTADPAVLFGSVTYAYAFPRRNVVLHILNRPSQLIDFDAGDNFTYGMGFAYAINYRLSLSFQFSDSITFSSRITQPNAQGVKVQSVVANSFINAAFLRMGVTWNISPTQSMEISLTQGLTTDAPDFTLGLRVPFRF